MLHETEGQIFLTTKAEKKVPEPDYGQDAVLLIENINCNDPFEIYELFVTDSIILLMVQQSNKYAIQTGTDNKTKKNIRAPRKLMNGLLFEDQILYTDSPYTSVPLTKSLLQRRTYFCGTVKRTRKFLSVKAIKKAKTRRILAMENSSGIKFVKWTNKKTVSLLTTCKNHKCILIEEKPGQMKPDLIFDYNNAKKVSICQIKWHLITVV
ncbi:hypothetical protein M0802_016358 [Mischocyttarus mexicanus]|nr:hypothetical protein M0802_016358 [Mischocyttarus mexicanus]